MTNLLGFEAPTRRRSKTATTGSAGRSAEIFQKIHPELFAWMSTCTWSSFVVQLFTEVSIGKTLTAEAAHGTSGDASQDARKGDGPHRDGCGGACHGDARRLHGHRADVRCGAQQGIEASLVPGGGIDAYPCEGELGQSRCHLRKVDSTEGRGRHVPR